MNAIEFRLSGRQASLAGISSTITRSINRQFAQQRIARVELRYSTQSPDPLAPQAAKQAISQLLRESGFGAAAVSVRAHEGPIDDATGEHLLRLVPAEPAVVAAAPASAQTSGLRAWLARMFPMWFGSAQGAASADQQTRSAGPAPRKSPPTTSAREAVAHLRKAVELAARYVETDTGTAVAAGSTAVQQIGEARVIVRLDNLHGVLGPLVSMDATKAAQSIGPMVRASGLATADAFKVSYSYVPRVAGDGTAYATESDVEVRLILASALVSSCTAGRSAASESTALACGTLMPAPATAQREATPALTLRVLGTLHADFAQPFVMHFASLPARFDRQALEQAGFARAHPGLLQVVSNSCPLHIRAGEGGEHGEQGEWLLDAGTRSVPGGLSTPMYFMPDTLTGLTSPLRITSARQRLIVNAPSGVHDPVSGRVLPALVIELVMTPSSASAHTTTQRPFEFAA